MAALLVTMGFVSVDPVMTVVQGDGIPGGRAGYWRFLPEHPAKKYSLAMVIRHGLNACQASPLPALMQSQGIVVYPEQAYIAAAFHNKRLLVESIFNGTRLKLDRVGYLYVFRRVGAEAIPELPGEGVARELMTASTRRTEMVAALATLGFEPAPLRQAPATSATMVTHEGGSVTWMLPEISKDGRWQLAERMSRYDDASWCARADNTDPIACISDAFWNLNQIRRTRCDERTLIRVQNGNRSILLPQNAPDAMKKRAADFLKGKA